MHTVIDKIRAWLDAAETASHEAQVRFAEWLREIANKVENSSTLMSVQASDGEIPDAEALLARCKELDRHNSVPGSLHAPKALGPFAMIAIQMAIAFLEDWIRRRKEDTKGE